MVTINLESAAMQRRIDDAGQIAKNKEAQIALDESQAAELAATLSLRSVC